uniref:Uncharacterized protein n=1 Tax=Kalanchoe fedtschenkoi TaxID=63787 RepID=A0A7N0TR31_KALFE
MTCGSMCRGLKGSVDGDRSSFGWKDLSPEILASVFVLLPVEKMMQAVPMVCGSWYEVVLGPYCWREIDIDCWCIWNHKPGRFLKVLEMSMSKVTDDIVKRHGGSLTNLTVLDISQCPQIIVIGLEDVKIDDREAVVIADTVIGLVKLELTYSRAVSLGLRAILNKCEGLTHLDIQGCRNIQQLEDATVEKCHCLVEFKYPWFYDSNFLCSADDGVGDEVSSSDTFDPDFYMRE